METHLPSIQESNPRVEVVTELIRGQHPHLKAFYRECLPLCFLPLQHPFHLNKSEENLGFENDT